MDYELILISEYEVEVVNKISGERALLHLKHKYVYDPPDPKTRTEKKRKGRIVRLEEIFPNDCNTVYVKYLDTNRSGYLNPIYLKPYEKLHNNKRNSELYNHWLKNMSDVERIFSNIALYYEVVYFNDLRLIDYQNELFFIEQSDRSLTESEFKDYTKSNDVSKYFESLDISYEQSHYNVDVHESISIIDWRILVHDNFEENTLGMACYDNKTIEISDSSIYQGCFESVLLHEMIHAYESIHMYEGINSYDGILKKEKDYDKYVTIRIYGELSCHIVNIDNILDKDIHFLNKEHSPLFLLKSLKLDLLLGHKFGTIYNYGRDTLFNDIILFNTDITLEYKAKFKERYKCECEYKFIGLEDK